VNAEFVQDGYAFAYVVFPFSKIDQFTALESKAQSANRSLWSACNVDSSSEIKQTAGPKT
jgi:endonuclease YncB( thermonuclease family)